MSIVRLNVNTGFDAETCDGEYGRIAKEIEILREQKGLVKGFDEELFR